MHLLLPLLQLVVEVFFVLVQLLQRFCHLGYFEVFLLQKLVGVVELGLAVGLPFQR